MCHTCCLACLQEFSIRCCPFCRNMLNKTLTETEIRDIWNTRPWKGKSPGDPFIVRGGYRCRHTWLPTNPEWNI